MSTGTLEHDFEEPSFASFGAQLEQLMATPSTTFAEQSPNTPTPQDAPAPPGRKRPRRSERDRERAERAAMRTDKQIAYDARRKARRTAQLNVRVQPEHLNLVKELGLHLGGLSDADIVIMAVKAFARQHGIKDGTAS